MRDYRNTELHCTGSFEGTEVALRVPSEINPRLLQHCSPTGLGRSRAALLLGRPSSAEDGWCEGLGGNTCTVLPSWNSFLALPLGRKERGQCLMTTQGVCATAYCTKGCPTDSLLKIGLLRAFCCKTVRREAVVRWVLCKWQMACRQGDALHPLAGYGSEFPVVLQSLLEENNGAMCCPGVSRARLLRKFSQLSRSTSRQTTSNSFGTPALKQCAFIPSC